MQLLLAVALVVTSVTGTVRIEDAPLPGCAVTLTGPSGQERKTVTDASGTYRIETEDPGHSNLTIELSGFETFQYPLFVKEGANPQPSTDLTLAIITETFTSTCGGPPCSQEAPQSIWDQPLCSDYELDGSLIESLKRGDASSLQLLRSRHASASTYGQKHRIAEALLGVGNDCEYWNELHAHAEIAMRFPTVDFELTDDFRRWCAERGLPAEPYGDVAFAALASISTDLRARPLMLDALKSSDLRLVSLAVLGFGMNRDESALPEIERMLERIDPGERYWLAQILIHFRMAAADRVAARHLDEHELREYHESQAMLEESRMAESLP